MVDNITSQKSDELEDPIESQEAQEPEESVESQKSEFALCLSDLYELISYNQQSSTEFIEKLNELDAIYTKRLSGFKHILIKQKEFHNINNKKVKLNTKEKNKIIEAQRVEIKNLKDAITVYQKIEVKYRETLKQLAELKK